MKNAWHNGRLVTGSQRELDLCEDLMRALLACGRMADKLEGVDWCGVSQTLIELEHRHASIVDRHRRDFSIPEGLVRTCDPKTSKWRYTEPEQAPDIVCIRRYEKRAWRYYQVDNTLKPVALLKLWDKASAKRVWRWVYDGPLTAEQEATAYLHPLSPT